MAKLNILHPQNPQSREVEAIRDSLRQGAVMLYPTDTVYAIGCDLTVKSAVQRVRQLKQMANTKPLTFMCSSLSNIAQYAWVSDSAYRNIRRLIPGPYTFLLPATKLVPRLVMSPKRHTTGIRVPDYPICLALIEALGNPIVSTSALSIMGDSASPIPSKAELFDVVGPQVDLIVDNEVDMGYGLSTIVDLTDSENPVIERKGLGWAQSRARCEWPHHPCREKPARAGGKARPIRCRRQSGWRRDQSGAQSPRAAGRSRRPDRFPWSPPPPEKPHGLSGWGRAAFHWRTA
ncbi:MAG: threonylcarbamoyl-AMP synthase [Leptolyngbya sp. SIO1D8]|nr:threonylcarbamoyl-AMP synthase [Leptolyngbya sp. SIO1D8]